MQIVPVRKFPELKREKCQRNLHNKTNTFRLYVEKMTITLDVTLYHNHFQKTFPNDGTKGDNRFGFFYGCFCGEF